MALTSGTRFGTYLVGNAIGEGGMGEVYRARDTELERDVAIKVLPESFASDESRVARFEQEAKTLAALNHANIAQVFGIARQDGQTAIVMELVEGPTLADRIEQGPLPPDEALNIALQITNALEAAHERGIVHRDLKPANIKLKPDGTVTVLDFGIAKAVDFEALSSGPQSPVMTTPVTQAGVILGTAAYMSPEQARGRPIDRRTDIWAFGCVLYEMLTGQPAFGGEDVPLTLARVLAHDTDLRSLPAMISPAVVQTLRICLQKDPKKRIADIRDVRLALEGAFDTVGRETAAARHVPLWRRIVPLAATAAVTAAVVIVVAGRESAEPAAASDRPVRHFVITVDQGPHDRLSSNQTAGQDITFSPDGTELVHVGEIDGTTYLFRRELDSGLVELIPGTESGIHPFYSPDGQRLGFSQGDYLKLMQLPNGRPLDIVEAGSSIAGATWQGEDIIYALRDDGLFRVSSAGGGRAEPLTTPDASRGETAHTWPELLPDGNSVLFTVFHGPGLGDARLAALSLDTGEWSELFDGEAYSGHYATSGHLVYGRAGVVFAVPFDLDGMSVYGQHVQVLDRVNTRAAGAQLLAISPDGSVAYFPDTGSSDHELVWVGRDGVVSPVGAPRRPFEDPRISPDGRLIGAVIDGNVWTYDLRRNQLAQIDTGAGATTSMAFSGDSTQIAFDKDTSRYYVTGLNSARGPELIGETSLLTVISDWSEQDNTLVMQANSGVTAWDVQSLSVDRKEFRTITASEGSESGPVVSPDGRYMAFSSERSGQQEIYLTTYPEAGRAIPVSSEGGTGPLWSRNGGELFFLDGSQLMAAAISLDPEIDIRTPAELFTLPPYSGDAYGVRTYDYDAVNDRFLTLRSTSDAVSPRINVVLNWFEELKATAPLPEQ